MPKIQIKNRFNDSVVFETDCETIGQAIAAAIVAKSDLCDADLRGADLRDANLCGANLCYADLCGADLRGADLRGADLRGANLCDANLCGANLCYANLRGANLRGADLRGADLLKLVSIRTIVADGDLIGWKKLGDGTICKLKIPSESKRVGGVVGRKCRAQYAIVLSGEGCSMRSSEFKYKVGETIKPDSFDPNPLVECSNGIHFFITKQEAEDYNG